VTQYAVPYTSVLKEFIVCRDVKKIVDLGCGDFSVAKTLATADIRYLGVDIVPELIERNRRIYSQGNINFKCMNIIEDELPDGDLCLLRQVLQHLSNAQILSVLSRVKKYRYVVITEHYPSAVVNTVPNRDKPHGPDTRILDDSGVYLDHPPFHERDLKLLLELEVTNFIKHPGEKLRTFLIANDPRK
jgi:hypothetical protein